MKINRKSLALAVLLLVGCAKLHRTPNSDGTPTAPVTSLETVNADNAQIAIHNHAVAEALVAAHQSGFIETEYFDKLSAGQIQITRMHQQLSPLLAGPIGANAAQVKGLLNQIAAIGQQMIQDGSAGVKNSAAKQQIVADLKAIIALANSITSTLTTAGVLK